MIPPSQAKKGHTQFWIFIQPLKKTILYLNPLYNKAYSGFFFYGNSHKP